MPKRAFFTEREFSRLQLFLSFCIIPHATTHAERWQSGNAADC